MATQQRNPVNNNTLIYKNGVTLLNNNCNRQLELIQKSKNIIQYINGDEEFGDGKYDISLNDPAKYFKTYLCNGYC